MDRRNFLRVIGGVAFTSAVAPRYGFAAQGSGSAGVLIEACMFDDLGGWALDTQFHQQMGGSFLLAHGMGAPVANAKTKFTLPEAGKWRAWVRTRDWCPGDWDAPGRFKLKVDGKDLDPVFGTEPGWAWQAGGEFEITAAGEHTLELEDLTGFDGRCDAVFFTKEDNPTLPNDDLVELSAWKDRVSGRTDLEIEEGTYDLVIVGGGMSGCGAALAARKHGLKVALVQDRPLFGGNASEEIRVHTLGIFGKSEDIIKQIDTYHYPNGDEKAKVDQVRRDKALADAGTDLFPGHTAIGLGKDGDKITSVEAREVRTGKIRRFKAPVFIDATGDGWIGVWAGAEFREGRESKNEFDEGWDRYGERWSPENPDMRVMGTSVLWNSQKGTQRHDLPGRPLGDARRQGSRGGQRRVVLGVFQQRPQPGARRRTNPRPRVAGDLRILLERQTPPEKRHRRAQVGRLRRRQAPVPPPLMGDYIYTMKDATELRKFPDTVVEETRELDGHYQIKETGSPYDFLSKAMFMKLGGKAYEIPFRCFYSRNISNLMMAGRCFSCSHVGLSGPRVMNTCAQMGIATGFAAVVCKNHGALPREVGEKHIQELRALIGYDA